MSQRASIETVLGVAVVAVAIMIAWGCQSSSNNGKNAAVRMNQDKPLPPLKIDYWINAGDTEPSLEALKGKVVVLEFWATWCGPCRQMIPHLKALHAEHAADGLVILAIHTPDDISRDKLTAFVEKNEIPYIVGFDRSGETSTAYEAYQIPHAYVINREGIVTFAGYPGDREFDQAINEALGT